MIDEWAGLIKEGRVYFCRTIVFTKRGKIFLEYDWIEEQWRRKKVAGLYPNGKLRCDNCGKEFSVNIYKSVEMWIPYGLCYKCVQKGDSTYIKDPCLQPEPFSHKGGEVTPEFLLPYEKEKEKEKQDDDIPF